MHHVVCVVLNKNYLKSHECTESIRAKQRRQGSLRSCLLRFTFCTTCLFVPPLSMLVWPWLTLVSLRSDKEFPRVLMLKSHGLETFLQAAFPSRDRFVHGHACGLVLKLQKNWGQMCLESPNPHSPFPFSLWSFIPFLPRSSFLNLGVIVSGIKHSCMDLSL